MSQHEKGNIALAILKTVKLLYWCHSWHYL